MQQETQRGIALYTAIIVGAIALLLATAMADIAFRQLVLSQTARASQNAFYAASTGVECVRYYDSVEKIFPTSSPSAQTTSVEVQCAGGIVTGVAVSDPGGAKATFLLEDIQTSADARSACADVVVEKVARQISGVTVYETTVRVDGIFPCEGGEGGPRSVQRSIEYSYGGGGLLI